MLLVGGIAVATQASQAQPVAGPGGIVGFGKQGAALPPVAGTGQQFVAVDGGGTHAIGLRSDGAAVAWGSGTGTVPGLPTGTTYTAVAVGDWHSLLLRSDGAVFGTGDNTYGQTQIPASLTPNSGVKAIAAGGTHSLALLVNGNVVGWGDDEFGQTDAPALPAGLKYTAIAAGGNHSLALRSDGSVVAFGLGDLGQATVPAFTAGVAITAIAAGGSHSLALGSDGRVVGFGNNESGQTTAPALPAGVTYTAIAAGDEHSLALRSDGKIAAFGYDGDRRTTVPALSETDIYVGVAAGSGSSYGIVGQGTPRTSMTQLALPSTTVGAGTKFTVRATVSAASGQPTGVVRIESDGKTLGSGQLIEGVANIEISGSLLPGLHRFSAIYQGDVHTSGSESSTVSITVSGSTDVPDPSAATSQTSISLPKSAAAGKTVTARVTVKAKNGGVPKGAVEIRQGSRWVASATLVNGKATISLPAVVTASTGVKKISASYLGSKNHQSSTSSAAGLRVVKAKSKITAKLSPAKVKVGSTPRMKVSVKTTGVASGKIQIRVGGKTIAKGTLGKGNSTLIRLPRSLTKAVGKKKITVIYKGSSTAAKTTRNVSITVRSR